MVVAAATHSPAPAPAAPAPAPGAPTPPPPPPPPPPPSSETGLSGPTGTLFVSLNQAGTLVSKARDAYNKSAGGFASVTLGDFSAGIGGGNSTQNCPGGGTATYTAGPAGADAGAYVYNDCVINGITYDGPAAITYTLTNGALTQYAIVEAAVTAVVNGQNVTLDDRVECTRDATNVVCVGHYGDNQWGDDFVFSAGTADGSYQCECNADRWNNVSTAMTGTSGQVSTQAATGTAVITRTSATTWTITITSGNSSLTYNVTL